MNVSVEWIIVQEYLVKISNKVSKPIVHSMAIPVVEFSREGHKIRKVFG